MLQVSQACGRNQALLGNAEEQEGMEGVQFNLQH